jgi:FXSXX-COOH protein
METGTLPDLGDIPLAELLDVASPVLADIMRRIAAEDDDSNIVAGFQSAI